MTRDTPRTVIKGTRRIFRYWVEPIVPIKQIGASLSLYKQYYNSWVQYKALPEAEPLLLTDSFPCIFDRTSTTPFDPHYFYQAVWAMERIAEYTPQVHVDVGSDIKFVGLLTTHVPVLFIDIRPLKVDLPRLKSISGSITSLPFEDQTLPSLSCLHVAEHIGLGRYGDQLDPAGTRRACRELSRVLAPGGHLCFSLPVGRPRVNFNAHRVHSPRQILEFFQDLTLVEFSLVDDQGNFSLHVDLDRLQDMDYSCGLFLLKR